MQMDPRQRYGNGWPWVSPASRRHHGSFMALLKWPLRSSHSLVLFRFCNCYKSRFMRLLLSWSSSYIDLALHSLVFFWMLNCASLIMIGLLRSVHWKMGPGYDSNLLLIKWWNLTYATKLGWWNGTGSPSLKVSYSCYLLWPCDFLDWIFHWFTNFTFE